MRKEKGAIAIFVLVTLLFMVGFLILTFAGNVNKSKSVKEQFNIISGIYSYSNGEEKAYSGLRKKNKQTMTASSQNSSTLELTKTFNENMSNYRIYGNSVQNGTPSPDNPVEIESVGDLVTDTTDSNYGKYRIPIKLTNENGESTTTNIYLDEPLRKVEDSADYIDFKTKKVVKYVKEKSFTGDDVRWWYWQDSITSNSIGVYYSNSTELGIYQSPKFSAKRGYSNYFKVTNAPMHLKDDSVLGEAILTPNSTPPYIGFKVPYTTLEDFKTEFLAKKFQEGNPLRITYNILTPEEQNINLSELSTFEDYTKIEVLTSVAPSKIEAEYQGYTLE